MLASVQCYISDSNNEIDNNHLEQELPHFYEKTNIRFTTFGDANADGAVNTADALAILKHAVQKETITDESAFFLCDLDQNQVLDSKDPLGIFRTAVGK